MLRPHSPDPLDELNALVGLYSVKQKLLAVLEVDKNRREQGLPVNSVNRHMLFVGPPGVGKTLVAQLLGRIYFRHGVLQKGHLVETDRASLVSGWIGQTAPQTFEVCKSALDGVLFIDEPNELNGDFGRESIDTILKFMADHRDRIVVIAGGYPKGMQRFISSNPEFASRFTTIDFPAYEPGELCAIMRGMAESLNYERPDEVEAKLSPWLERERKGEHWGNAREMRILLEKALEAQALRISRDPTADPRRIEMDDFMAATGVS